MYFTISTHWECDSVCVRVCARLFIFALRLTPQVTAHTASAHQTPRVRPIFHPFDFVESFVRCHHEDLNRLCRLLNWQRYSSSSCLYFPPLPLCQFIPFFHPLSVLIFHSVILIADTVPSRHVISLPLKFLSHP